MIGNELKTILIHLSSFELVEVFAIVTNEMDRRCNVNETDEHTKRLYELVKTPRPDRKKKEAKNG